MAVTVGTGGPVTMADVEAQAAWLISAWDSLVTNRPEFGKLSTPARQQQRRESIASSANAIYGVIGAMSTMYTDNKHDIAVAFAKIAAHDGQDLFAWDNPIWTDAGIVVKSGDTGKLTMRNSYQSRRAAIRIMHEQLGLDSISDDGSSDLASGRTA